MGAEMTTNDAFHSDFLIITWIVISVQCTSFL